MEQNTYEREVDLMQLIMVMWRKVWVILIAGIIGGALIGGYRLVPGIRTLRDPEIIKEQEEKYASDMKLYEESVETAEKEIENLVVGIDRQKEYNEKSSIMKINPFDKQVASISFYVDTNYQIMPGSVYQNPDMTKSILRAYMSIVQDGTMYNYIMDNLERKIEIRYLKEMISFNVDYDNRMIFVEVIHGEKDAAKKILSLIQECFAREQEVLINTIGDHTLDAVNESEYATVDLDLETLQKGNIQKVVDLEKSLTEKKDSFEKLVAPVKTIANVKSVIINAVKYAIIGGVLGVFVSVGSILFLFIIDKTIKDEKDVGYYLGLPVLATIPTVKGQEAAVKAGRKNKKKRLNQYEA